MFKTNDYYGGKVKSIAFQTTTLPATIGVMAQGDYQFGTREKELLTVTSGSLTVKLPGTDEWQTFGQGESFEVGANQAFQVRADVESSYLCLYG